MNRFALRRAAACRSAILDTGRADPWPTEYGPVPLTEHQRKQWAVTVEHLRREALTAIVSDPELAAHLGCAAGVADE